MKPLYVVIALGTMAMYLVSVLIFCAWKLPTQQVVILFISNTATGLLSALYTYLRLEDGVPVPPGSISTTTVQSTQKVESPAPPAVLPISTQNAE
jgi:hypothetical protein